MKVFANASLWGVNVAKQLNQLLACILEQQKYYYFFKTNSLGHKFYLMLCL